MLRSKVLHAIILCGALAACQKPVEDNGGSAPGPDPRTGEVTTDCGIVTNGRLSNPVNLDDGQAVRVTQVLSNNLVLIQDIGGTTTQLVKLQGVASSTSTSGRQMIQGLTSPDATFFKATSDCNVPLDGGGNGTIGQLISGSGKSVSEQLIKSGYATVDANDACSGNLLGACFSALTDNGGPDPDPTDPPTDSIGEIEQFLWKPLSDTKGPIAVVLERHCNTTIRVNGESFSNSGGGNGRCTTGSGRKAGCAYGKNVRVEVIDNQTGKHYTHNGQPFITVPDGCSRFGS
jgi:hypothetical protein